MKPTRLAVESLLGLQLEVDRLRITPLVPDAWDGFDVHYRFRETLYHIHVRNHRGAHRVVVDGEEQVDRAVPLRDDRRDHEVEVDLPGRPAQPVKGSSPGTPSYPARNGPKTSTSTPSE